MNENDLGVCGKVKHSTEAEANSAAIELGAMLDETLYTYKCRACHAWHLTSKNPNEKK